MRLTEVLADNERLRRELETAAAERDRLSNELHRARSVEAVAQQAVAVAHDFGNVATMISGYSQLILRSLVTEDPALRANLDGIRSAAEWAGSLARQLMAAYRNESAPATVVNLNDVVAGVEPLLRLLLGEEHQLELSLEPGLGLVSTHRSQMEQVLTNLVANARDALTGRGQVTIATANVEVNGDAAAAGSELAAGPYVRLAVTDTGRGIDPAVRRRLFAPHFTTKEDGKGNGLGLFTARDVVKRSGGAMRVVSEAGAGSTFEVYLPRVVPPPAGDTGDRGGETVLVVEDETQVRDLIRDVLSLHGYTVLVAADGTEALEVDAAHPGHIHALIIDVVMPGTAPEEVVRRIGGRRPQLKTVYMSGYTDDLVRQHGLLRVGKDFLQKPFTVDALAAKIREVLDGV